MCVVPPHVPSWPTIFVYNLPIYLYPGIADYALYRDTSSSSREVGGVAVVQNVPRQVYVQAHTVQQASLNKAF